MQLQNKRVVVMGLGQFGGGVGVTKFLVSRGAQVLVTDQAAPDKLADSVKQLAGLPVTFRLGEHRTQDFTSADLIVVNPAVKPHDNEYLKAAMSANVKLTSEIRMLIAQLPDGGRARVIGITGSAGKSTTTAMIGHVLSNALGPEAVHVGGNLGGSLLSELERIKPEHWVVLELSSFMLEGLREDRWSPGIAVVTSFAPNHLDWHGTLESYRHAKQTLLDHQRPGDVAVLDPSLRDWRTQPGIRRAIAADSSSSAGLYRLVIPGAHNQSNAALAATACAAAGVDETTITAALEEFPGLPHRLQFVCEHRSVRYFNDSKATTPEATMLALRSFDASMVHIILGGYDKKADLTEMAQFAATHAAGIYTIGQTGDTIAGAAEKVRGQATVVRCGDLDRALAQIAANVKPGNVVLLSPACASWGQFMNYEQRGAKFIEAVLKYTGEGSSIAMR